jgi:hypothetical protein
MICKLISALIVAVAFAACAPVRPFTEASVKSDVRRQNAVSFESLKRSEYEVIGNVKGYGTVNIIRKNEVLGSSFDVSYDRKFAGYSDEGFVAPDISGWTTNFAVIDELASRIALYDALSKAPGADYILLPRYEISYEVSSGTNSVVATVFGKAIRIKADRDLPDTDSISGKFSPEPVKAAEAVKTNEVTVIVTNVVTLPASNAVSSVGTTNAPVSNVVKKAR